MSSGWAPPGLGWGEKTKKPPTSLRAGLRKTGQAAVPVFPPSGTWVGRSHAIATSLTPCVGAVACKSNRAAARASVFFNCRRNGRLWGQCDASGSKMRLSKKASGARIIWPCSEATAVG